MRGQRALQILSRQDVCLFCTLRLGITPASSHPIGRPQRLFHAAPSSNGPPATAQAVAEVESDDSPHVVHQPSSLSKSTPSSWPAFMPKRPIAKAIEPDVRPRKPTQPPAESSTWKCSACGNANLPRRSVCTHCKLPKPGTGGQPGQSTREPSPTWGRFLTQNIPSDDMGAAEHRRRQRDLRWQSNLGAGRQDPAFRHRGSFNSEFDIRRLQDSKPREAPFAFGREHQQEQERQPTFGKRDPFISTHDRSRNRDPHRDEQNTDTGDRSGLESLLSFTRGMESAKKSSKKAQGAVERRTRTQGNVTPNLAFVEPQYRRVAYKDLATPSASEVYGGRDITRHQEGQLSRQNRLRGEHTVGGGNAVPRSRGRFGSEEEGFEGDPQASRRIDESRRGRRNGRRAPRETENVFDEMEEDLLLERTGRRKKSETTNVQLEPTRTPIVLPDFITVGNLATVLRVKTETFIARMEEMGFDRPRNDHILDAETSGLIATEFNFEPVFGQEAQLEDLVARPQPPDTSLLPPRPPIVTIMGHVDHGKTTILDWLRKSSVAASEHGGITQHIGAFSVAMPGGKLITFLDTPGHAAFLDMRRRGANVTDIVILVVAADDSVKPQTVEAIKHATDAKVPIIVAMNKVDKQDSNADQVKQDLARHGITVEDYGGDVQAIPVSGKFGNGMAELEEATVALSEMLDHRAETDGPVEGRIIESKVTLAGRVATVLIRRGTLRPGDIIVAGTTWARIRSLRNDAGALVDEAPPGTPVQIDGWRADDPAAGQEVLQADDEDYAKKVVELRREKNELTKLADDTVAINATRAEDAEARVQQLALEAEEQAASSHRRRRRPKDNVGWIERKGSGGPKQIHFIVKADVSGSVEAIVNSISAIGNNEIAANVIDSGVGVINESDIQYLTSSGEKGHLISFNQPVDPNVSRLAEAAGLEILDHSIIYRLTDSVKRKLSAELAPAISQRVLGEAEIGQVFEISDKKKTYKIAGCKIKNGMVSRDRKIRVVRASQVIYDGSLRSLKNVKKDVAEMRKGSECGIGFENWEDFEPGDQIQSYEEQKTERTL